MTDSNRLAALNNACIQVAATTGFAEALSATLHYSAALAGAGSAMLLLYNKTTGQWFVHSYTGIVPEAVVERTPMLIRAAAAGEPVQDGDALALPLKAKGRVVGVVAVDRSGGVLPEDRPIFEIFSTAAALAIESTLTKTDFVSTVTHELRLPMTSIKGYSDLIRGGMAGPVSDMQKQLLDTVRSNVDWMNSLVSDLSDIAKLETGRLKLDLETLDPAECVREAVSVMQTQFDAKTQTVTVQADPPLPPVRGDRKRTVQMLQYILTNATRYTKDNGQITVTAQPQGDTVRISVTDTGVGMTPEDKAKLFNQFFRSEDQVVRDHKGWGLALHLVKSLAENSGGSAGAESEYGKGSTFWFELPVVK
jgi:signal transduction histidine kinase